MHLPKKCQRDRVKADSGEGGWRGRQEPQPEGITTSSTPLGMVLRNVRSSLSPTPSHAAESIKGG